MPISISQEQMLVMQIAHILHVPRTPITARALNNYLEQ